MIMPDKCVDAVYFINQGSNGIMPILYSIKSCIPIAWDALLLVVFFVLFSGNYYLIKNKTGRAKVMIALLASSFSSVIFSLFFAIMDLVNFASVLLYAFILILTFIIFVTSDNS